MLSRPRRVWKRNGLSFSPSGMLPVDGDSTGRSAFEGRRHHRLAVIELPVEAPLARRLLVTSW